MRLPGAYPFCYGSATQSAVFLASGFDAGKALRQTAVFHYLAAEERVRQLTSQKRVLRVRKARPQRDGMDAFSAPNPADAADDKGTLEVVANEKRFFLAQGAILRGQINLLRSQKGL